MAMSHRDRFKLKSQLVEALNADEWTLERTNLLLGELGVQQLDGDWRGPTLTDIIGEVSDRTLADLYALVMNIDEHEVMDVVESADGDGNWSRGSSVFPFVLREIQRRSPVRWLTSWPSPASMPSSLTTRWSTASRGRSRSNAPCAQCRRSSPWSTPECNESAWCHQEVGCALGRRVPRYALRVGADPAGFIGREQWPSVHGQTPKQVSNIIYTWLVNLPELGTSIVDGLLKARADAGNYVDAGAAAERVAALGGLSAENFDRLDATWWSNDQLHGGFLATKQMRPFYERHGRPWPPPKLPAAAASAALGADDEPF